MKYPFQPDILDAIPEELAELFRSLELTLLKEICSRLKAADQLNEVTVQDIRALRSHGIDLKDIELAIKETTGISQKRLTELLEEVVERNQQYYREVIDLAHVTVPEALVSAADIAAITAQAQREFGNLTRSMGFLVDNGRTMLPPAKAYQWALDNAEMQIQSGAISYNQAIANAVKQLAGSGIKTVNYERGHIDSIDVAARRAVMTGVSQLCGKYTEQSAEYLDTRYFEVSAHSGARDKPGPSPWSSHKDWQGKVYYMSDHGEPDPLGKYPDLVEKTGFGYVDGLEGANCRHRRWAWVEDIMERTYTDKQLAHIDDGLGCEFEGKRYTAYEATQMQRSIERSIRKQKRLKDAYKAAGLTEDAAAAGAKLNRLNQKYKDFSKAAGLPEQRERTKAYVPMKLTEIDRFSPLKEYDGGIKVVEKFSSQQYVVKVEPPVIEGATKHFYENLADRYDRAWLTIEAAQGIISSSKMVLYQPNKQALKFLADGGYVVLNMQKKIVTAVPEKLRKKYKDYLEGKKDGKKP